MAAQIVSVAFRQALLRTRTSAYFGFYFHCFRGMTGAFGYLLAAHYIGWHIKPDLRSNPITHSAVPFFAIMICAT